MEKTLFWAVAALVLIFSLILGKKFSDEAKKIKAAGKPLYQAYFTPSGIIILIIFSIIILFYMFF